MQNRVVAFLILESMCRRIIIWCFFAVMLAIAIHGQRRVSLYDEWFHSASCVLHREVSGDSLAYCLAVTLDEGNIFVPAGSKLQIRLRGAVNIELTSTREVTSRDIHRRRYATHTDSYITCHYHISESQLVQLSEHEMMQLRIETAQGWIVRRAMRHLKLY